MTKKRLAIATLALAITFGAFYFCCGLFVVQPLGVSREGSTFLFWRIGTDLPFVSSADGFLLQQTPSPTAAARGAALGQWSDVVLKRRIAKLPYSRQLYLLSTSGIDLDR